MDICIHLKYTALLNYCRRMHMHKETISQSLKITNENILKYKKRERYDTHAKFSQWLFLTGG